MRRYIAVGAIIGIMAGLILPIMFPQFLYLDIIYKVLFNRQLGYPPDYYSPQSGGILTGEGIFVVFFGIVGALLGLILSKIKKSRA